MEAIIKAHHVSITEPLRVYAQKKISKIEKYFDHIQDVTVELHVHEVAEERVRQEASVIVHASGAALKATHKTGDMYASIDGVYDKIAAQLKKHKEKLKASKREAHQKRQLSSILVTSKEPRKKTKKEPLYVKKPMTPEDAASLLEEKAVSFLVFKNSDTLAINVIYPDKKGVFSLIETE